MRELATLPGTPHTDARHTASLSFGDRVAELVAARRSQLVLGLDPDPARLWPRALASAPPRGFEAAPPRALASAPPRGLESARLAGHSHEATRRSPAERAAQAVTEHCRLALAATAEHCVAVKLQVACFERLGAPGWAALEAVTATGREHGLLVIADAKRGDIDVSAAAYAQAFLGETPTPFGMVAGLGVDALTVNPLLGTDSVQPFVDAARRRASGLFLLVRTSNPGAADVQERELAAGGTVTARLAELARELGAAGVGEAGLSDVGAVVGATAPERMEALRTAMPRAVFLIPGVGAQGGRIEGLAAAFAPGPAGGLITVSRGLVGAYEKVGGDPGDAARAEAARLRELAWNVAG